MNTARSRSAAAVSEPVSDFFLLLLDFLADSAGAAGESEAAERPELRARVVEIYKLGEARYLRLLLSTPDVRRIGQASRTAGAPPVYGT